MLPTRPVVLADATVRLEPLTAEHAEALFATVAAGRETYTLTRVPSTLPGMAEFIAGALDEQSRGLCLPFATVEVRTGRVVGGTRFMNIERWKWPAGHALQRPAECTDAVEIGSTWLSPEAQRTAVNTHAKLLMLTHAFEAWEVHRVTLKTDSRNARSRAAIERLGARPDGVLRAHMPGFDGAIRDTAFYSIVAAEWAAVKARLDQL